MDVDEWLNVEIIATTVLKMYAVVSGEFEGA